MVGRGEMGGEGRGMETKSTAKLDTLYAIYSCFEQTDHDDRMITNNVRGP